VRSEGARRLGEWLAERGRSQRWLADVLGVRQSAVSQWISGVHTPSLRHRIMLSGIAAIEQAAWDSDAVRAAVALARERAMLAANEAAT